MSRASRQQRKRDRHNLVHAAGCVFPTCCSKWFRHDDIRLDPTCALAKGVRVPRSLRRIFGFRVAP